MEKIKIGKKWIGENEKTYIIAEIGSNFNGSIEQAKKMVDLSIKVGADAVKFQSFIPDKIISREGFKKKSSFQARWNKSVYDTYKDASFPRKWHKIIRDYCRRKEITFFSSPYDSEAVDLLEKLDVPAYKIGSGDITFLSLIEYIARKGRPIILGTGASTLGEIEEAVKTIRSAGNEQIILLQCITNYPSPIIQANIRVMGTLKDAFQVPVGYSDHSPGITVALGAVALGACVIEKHFTFDKTQPGPDHPFAMDVQDFSTMVREIRLLESALGSQIKNVVPAEKETVVLQRRSLYAGRDIQIGTIITKEMVETLRPAKGLLPKEINRIVGRKTKTNIKKGSPISWDMV